MADAALLSDEDIEELLTDHPTWSRSGDRLVRTFEFVDFSMAFAFMTRVAEVAEDLFHHPEWSNVWNRVVVDLVTHDAGGLTQNDLELARTMQKLGDGV